MKIRRFIKKRRQRELKKIRQANHCDRRTARALIQYAREWKMLQDLGWFA